MYCCYQLDSEATIDFQCYDEDFVNRGTLYICFLKDGSGFVQWRVLGLASPVSLQFSNTTNPVGESFADEGFTAVLTDLSANSMNATLGFDVTEDLNGIQIICDDPDPSFSDTKTCDITVRGKTRVHITIICYNY